MHSYAILQLLDRAAREERAAFVFDGDEVQVAAGLEGTNVLLEPGRVIDVAQVEFAGLI